MQPRLAAALSFLAIGRIAVGRPFLDSRVVAFLIDARYSRSGASCTWKPDYAVAVASGNKAGALMRIGPIQRNKEILEARARWR